MALISGFKNIRSSAQKDIFNIGGIADMAGLAAV